MSVHENDLFIIIEHVNSSEVTAIATVGGSGGHLCFSMGVDVYDEICVRVRANVNMAELAFGWCHTWLKLLPLFINKTVFTGVSVDSRNGAWRKM